jgi:hypothetical protein
VHSRTFEALLADPAARIQATLGAEFWSRIQYFRSNSDTDRHLREITRDFRRLFVSSNVSNVKAWQAQVNSTGEYGRTWVAGNARQDEGRLR